MNNQLSPSTNQTVTQIEQLKEVFASSGYTMEEAKIPGYQYSMAVWIYIALNFTAILLSFFQPILGLILGIIFWLLFVKEIFYPMFGKFMAGQTNKYQLTIPARSKETQKLFIIHSLSTEKTLKPIPGMNQLTYLITLLGLGMMIVLGLYLNHFFLPQSLYSLYAFIPLVAIGIFNRMSNQSQQATYKFHTSEVLAEVISVLSKMRALTTSITICLTDNPSPNTGLSSLLPMLKTAPELTYILNIVDSAHNSSPDIAILKQEGPFPQKGDLILQDLIREVASEKNVGIKAMTTTDFTEIFGLLLNKRKALTVLYPGPSNHLKQKELREILLGLIRKLDH